MAFRTELLWERGTDTDGVIRAGRSFPNYSGIVYTANSGGDPDLFTVEPVGRLRNVLGQILIISDTRFVQNPTIANLHQIWGVISDPGIGAEFSTPSSVILYRWVTDTSLTEGGIVTPPDAPSDATSLALWNASVPAEPTFTNGATALFRVSAIVNQGEVSSSTNPTQQGATVYRVTSRYYRWVTDLNLAADAEVTAPATPTNTIGWSTTQPTAPLIATGGTALFYSDFVLRNGVISSATAPAQQGTVIRAVTTRRYRWFSEAGVLSPAPVATPTTPTADETDQWTTTVPTAPQLAVVGASTLFFSDFVTNGTVFVSASAPVQQGSTIYTTVQRRFRWFTASIIAPATVPIPATPSTTTGWSTTVPTQPSVFTGAAALFYYDFVSNNNTLVSVGAPAQQGATVYRTTERRYRWFNANITSPAAFPAQSIPSSLSGWTTTQMTAPDGFTGGALAQFYSDFTLDNGEFVSAQTPIQQGTTIYITTQRRFQWVSNTTLTSPTPVTAPATPTSTTGWAVVQPSTPLLSSGGTALFYSDFRSYNNIFNSASAPIQQGLTVYYAVERRFRWFTANVSSPATVPTPSTPVSTDGWSLSTPAIPADYTGAAALFVVDFTTVNGAVSSASTPVQQGATVYRVQGRRFRWIHGNVSFPSSVATPATPTSTTGWSTSAPATPSGFTTGALALFYSDFTFQDGSFQSATTPIQQGLTVYATVQRRYRWFSSANVVSPANVPSGSAPTALTGWSATIPAAPVIASGAATLYYADFVLYGGQFQSVSAVIQQGNTVYTTVQRRYFWNTVTVASPNPIAVPATPTSLIGWSVAIPPQPSLNTGQGTQLFFVDFTLSNGAFQSATSPTAQGNAAYAAIISRRYRWFTANVVSPNPVPTPLTPTALTGWSITVPVQPALVGGQGAQLFYVDFSILNDVFQSATTPVTQGSTVYVAPTVTQRRYMWNVVTAAEGVMIPTPATPTSFTGWVTTVPTQPALTNGQGTQLFYSDFQITSNTSTFVSAALPVSQGAAVYQTTTTQRRYMWNVVTAAQGVMIPVPATPTSFTGWATTVPTQPTLIGGQGARLFYSDFQVDSNNAFFSAATPVAQGNAVYRTIIYTQVFSVSTGTGSGFVNYFAEDTTVPNAVVLTRVSSGGSPPSGFPTMAQSGTYRLRFSGSGLPSGVTGSVIGSLSTFSTPVPNNVWYSIRVGSLEDMQAAFGATGGIGGFGYTGTGNFILERQVAMGDRVPSQDFNTLITAGSTNTTPLGIFADSTHMWVADSGGNKLFAYNKATKARVPTQDFNTLDNNNGDPRGIFADGTHMWVANYNDIVSSSQFTKIFAYNLSTKARVPSQDFNTLHAASNGQPTGIWSDGTHMWVADNNDDKIYAYNLSTKARVPSQDFDTLNLPATDNANPRGIFSDGTYMWVLDPNHRKIFAYNLSTKARVSSQEFNTLDSNNLNPYGIYSDGTYMWVSDFGGNSKLFAYAR